MRNRVLVQLAKEYTIEDALYSFEDMFCQRSHEAILVTEVTYAKESIHVVPHGVFTHIGAFASALQYLFDVEWTVNATMTGKHLIFHIDKGIPGFTHRYACSFVDLNQTCLEKHHQGWSWGRDDIPTE